MTGFRKSLPQLGNDFFLTDGGMGGGHDGDS
jgi:hypothetical protein